MTNFSYDFMSPARQLQLFLCIACLGSPCHASADPVALACDMKVMENQNHLPPASRSFNHQSQHSREGNCWKLDIDTLHRLTNGQPPEDEFSQCISVHSVEARITLHLCNSGMLCPGTGCVSHGPSHSFCLGVRSQKLSAHQAVYARQP